MIDEHISQEQLYAYDDGMLTGVERRVVERHLATCGQCRARLAFSAAIVRGLKRQARSISAPPSLRTAVLRHADARESRRSIAPWAPARLAVPVSLAMLGLVLLVILLALSLAGGHPLVTQLVAAHREGAQAPQTLQMPGDAAGLSAWLGGQVHERIDLPALEGFSLAGGRLDTIESQSAAHVLYVQGNASALSIFFWQGTFSTENLVSRQVNDDLYYVGTQDGESIVLWRDANLNYACVGEVTPEAVLALATRVRGGDVR